MNWQDLIDRTVDITTGDGVEWSLSWKPDKRVVVFNTADADYIGQEGTYRQRRKSKGAVVPLTVYFTGAECVTESRKFEKSARDPRPWKVSHPYYGSFLGQPASISFDDSSGNVSTLTIPLLETLDRKQPTAGRDLKGEVGNKAEATADKAVAAFELSHSTSGISDSLTTQARLNSSVVQANTRFGRLTELQQEATDLRNSVSTALSTVEAYVANATTAIVAIRQLYTLPSRFVTGVKARLNAFLEQLEGLYALVNPLGRDEYDSKLAAEAEGAMLISAVALASVQPAANGEDYQKRQDVIDVIEFISSLRTIYINNTDRVTVGDAGDVNVYYANAEAIAAVNELVAFTTSALYEILFNTRQERSEILTAASNPILLTHRFYGMGPNEAGEDENLEFFIKTNDFSADELLEIPAGREVVYYVG